MNIFHAKISCRICTKYHFLYAMHVFVRTLTLIAINVRGLLGNSLYLVAWSTRLWLPMRRERSIYYIYNILYTIYQLVKSNFLPKLTIGVLLVEHSDTNNVLDLIEVKSVTFTWFFFQNKKFPGKNTDCWNNPKNYLSAFPIAFILGSKKSVLSLILVSIPP